MDLAAKTHALSRLMPAAEKYRLTNQLLRAASSIPADLAEGHACGTRKDYANFVSIAYGSLAEAETHVLLAVKTGMLTSEQTACSLRLCDEIGRMLNALRARLREAPNC